ncbi:MAG: hypothetical protein E6J42_00455 [Chloroflexi bacterium]|nr:MAG: hypothetical protein E6J42_00455 [Chloroflexota bacterium]
MISKEAMHRVILEHVQAENDNARERVLATYSRHSPVFDDVPSGARYTGGDEIVNNYRHLWDGFPALKREITRWTFGDDSVVIELTLSGKHVGMNRGVPASGRQLELRVIAHFQFDDEGRIQQETAYYDALTFTRQLGIARDTAPTARH